MLEEIKADRKVTVRDMKDIALDVVDIQARESLPTMLRLTMTVAKEIQGPDRQRYFEAVVVLERWDFKFTRESAGAAIFAMWEATIASYLHE
jgi:hypothetical protein